VLGGSVSKGSCEGDVSFELGGNTSLANGLSKWKLISGVLLNGVGMLVYAAWLVFKVFETIFCIDSPDAPGVMGALLVILYFGVYVYLWIHSQSTEFPYDPKKDANSAKPIHKAGKIWLQIHGNKTDNKELIAETMQSALGVLCFIPPVVVMLLFMDTSTVGLINHIGTYASPLAIIFSFVALCVVTKKTGLKENSYWKVAQCDMDGFVDGAELKGINPALLKAGRYLFCFLLYAGFVCGCFEMFFASRGDLKTSTSGDLLVAVAGSTGPNPYMIMLAVGGCTAAAGLIFAAVRRSRAPSIPELQESLLAC